MVGPSRCTPGTSVHRTSRPPAPAAIAPADLVGVDVEQRARAIGPERGHDRDDPVASSASRSVASAPMTSPTSPNAASRRRSAEEPAVRAAEPDRRPAGGGSGRHEARVDQPAEHGHRHLERGGVGDRAARRGSVAPGRGGGPIRRPRCRRRGRSPYRAGRAERSWRARRHAARPRRRSSLSAGSCAVLAVDGHVLRRQVAAPGHPAAGPDAQVQSDPTTLPRSARLAARSSNGIGAPSYTVIGPSATLSRSGSSRAPARPAAAAIRPQLGSAPWTADFTRLEPATARATSRASPSSCAPRTSTSIRCRAPSPSDGDLLGQRTAHRLESGLERGQRAARQGLAARAPAGHDQDGVVRGRVAVDGHLVEGAVDHLVRSASRKASGVVGASVVMNASMVPICGWIIPEPLAIPAMRDRTPPTEVDLDRRLLRGACPWS